MLTLRAGKHLNADGLNADGLNADGLDADGLDADGLNRQWLLIQTLQTLDGTRNDAAAEQTLSNQSMPKALRHWMRE